MNGSVVCKMQCECADLTCHLKTSVPESEAIENRRQGRRLIVDGCHADPGDGYTLFEQKGGYAWYAAPKAS